MDHDVVRRDATWKEIGIDDDSLDGNRIRLCRVRDEDSPDGKQLAELEGILVLREVKLDLQRALSRPGNP